MKWLRLCGIVTVALAAALSPACNRASSNRTRVAFITNNPYDFWKIAQRGTEKAAKEFDVDVDFKMPSGGGSAEEQRRFIEDMLSTGIKGIAISPNDAANQTEFLKKVNAKVPLLTQDSDLPDPTARRCYIGTDNYTAGRAVGQIVKKAVPNGGQLVIFVGKLDVQNAIERRQGVLDELAGKERGQGDPAEKNHQYGKFTLLDTKTDDGKSDKCQDNAADMLVKFPEVACMVGLWEYNPPAILRAVRKARKAGWMGKVAIVGFDENDETLDGIKQGDVVATVVQNPFEFGYLAVKILAALARGDDSVLKDPKMDAEHRLYVPHRVITKENVNEFHKKLNELKGK